MKIFFKMTVLVLVLSMLPAGLISAAGDDFSNTGFSGQPPEASAGELGYQPQASAAVTIDHYRTRESITQMAMSLRHSGFDARNTTSYDVAPSLTAPYSAGSLSPADIADAENTLKMVRYIAGLPYESIEFSSEYNNIAQHGAVLLAASGQFSHYPVKPDDMDQDFFDIAYKGCSQANIYLGRTNISSAVLGFIADGGANNIERAGHRRWILNPGNQSFGIGYAKNIINMHVFGGARLEPDSYIAWPGSGDFPIQYFTASSRIDYSAPYPWSLNLGAEYRAPVKDDITLTLTRLRDNKVWVFDKNTPNLGVSGMSNDLMHLAVDNGGYGIGKAIIFRPDLTTLGPLSDGDVFVVHVAGIKTSGGADTVLQYSINFFDLEKAMVEEFVTRLYVNVLERAPEEYGLNAWVERLMSRKYTGSGIASEFYLSKEFAEKNIPDDEFIENLYRTMMNRASDEPGREAWLSRLAAGWSRTQVFRGFAESAEFAQVCNFYGIIR